MASLNRNTSPLPAFRAFATVCPSSVQLKGNTMWNIIIGLIMIIGGATGKLALIGTQSSGALVAVGVVLLGWGVFSLVRNKNA
jgi:hypothetical protein